jgi:hypothetical protein
MLPEWLEAPFQEHVNTVQPIHQRDLAEGSGRVQMLTTLDASILTRPPNGASNGCFRRRTGGQIPTPGNRAGITLMSRLSRKRCETRL